MGFRPQGVMNEVPEWLSYLNFADTDWLAVYVDPNPHTYVFTRPYQLCYFLLLTTSESLVANVQLIPEHPSVETLH